MKQNCSFWLKDDDKILDLTTFNKSLRFAFITRAFSKLLQIMQLSI